MADMEGKSASLVLAVTRATRTLTNHAERARLHFRAHPDFNLEGFELPSAASEELVNPTGTSPSPSCAPGNAAKHVSAILGMVISMVTIVYALIFRS